MSAEIRNRQQGIAIKSSTVTVGSFLQNWLDEAVRPNVRPWTYKGYEVIVRCHLTPDLGHIPLVKLGPQEVQALINRKREAGLAPKYVQSIRGVLRTALNEGMRWEMVHRNVAALVRVPRSEPKAIRPLSPEDARVLLTAAQSDRLGALYSVALALGLRQGEALGLRWEDIDLDRRVLKVENQLQRLDGRLQLVPLKTRTSKRVLPIPPTIVASLVRHQRTQLEERDAAGSRWKETGLVFTSTVGSGLDGPNVTKSFQRLLLNAGLDHRRFHDLRHSCATLLLAQDVAPRVVMEILGHSQISLTMNTYTHVMPELRQRAAVSMELALTGRGARRVT
jgi:integrase